VETWLTGPRLVSLPFSDHCQPLANSSTELGVLLISLLDSFDQYRCKYLELRPLDDACLCAHDNRLVLKQCFSYHALDLHPDLETIFHGFHYSCVRRKIRRAETENVICYQGRSEKLIRQFYHLLVMTRRRHGLVPQPLSWFRNLCECLGELVTIRVACWRDRPIAGIITLRYKNRMIYKYGGSDRQFRRLGGMAFLFWQAIQEAKRLGIEEFDLGRSDNEDQGLIDFKNRLGAVSKSLRYYSFPCQRSGHVSFIKTMAVQAICTRMPDAVLRTAGMLLYRHMG
jgi:hypothetical protein